MFCLFYRIKENRLLYTVPFSRKEIADLLAFHPGLDGEGLISRLLWASHPPSVSLFLQLLLFQHLCPQRVSLENWILFEVHKFTSLLGISFLYKYTLTYHKFCLKKLKYLFSANTGRISASLLSSLVARKGCGSKEPIRLKKSADFFLFYL